MRTCDILTLSDSSEDKERGETDASGRGDSSEDEDQGEMVGSLFEFNSIMK